MSRRPLPSAFLASVAVLCTLLLPVTVHGDDDTTTTSSTAPTTSTTVPETTIPESSVPDTTSPDTTSPDTTSPGTTSPPTTAPVDLTSQEVSLTLVDIAVAETGGNTVADVGAIGEVSGGAGITTGDASAVGSQDTTAVSQSASISLSDQATADVTQIALVFNIGVAAAGTGTNLSTAGSTGGGVATGDATAVGNEGTNNIIQFGNASSSVGSTVVGQMSVTIRIGGALADTGGNTAAGAATGATSTGDATAIGNLSQTSIEQIANAVASGNGNITIGQTAVVVNVGIALSNSGLNGLTDFTGAFVDNPDQTLAEGLFALLLPALFGSALSAGTGAVATGDATAVGNHTVTDVRQNASATADGTGAVNIQQQVVVANMGAAVANSGVNGSGVVTLDQLDAPTRAVVQQLAAFLTQLLQALTTWVPGQPLPDVPQQLSLALGGLLVGLDGSVNGVDSTLTGAGGQVGGLHQITAIVNLGVSFAGSGGNVAIVTGTDAAGQPAVALVVPAISTGDATAVNHADVVVCQVVNVAATACSPAATVVDVGGPTPVVGSAGDRPIARPRPVGESSGVLPFTGTDALGLIRLAELALALGIAASMVAARRRGRSLR